MRTKTSDETVRRACLASIIACAALLAGAACDPLPEVPRTAEATFGSSHCALAVSDEEALAEIEALIAEVDALEAAGALTSGQANALRNHLVNASKHIEHGRYCPALAQLEAFREQVSNFVEDGVLDEEEAEPLLDGVGDVLDEPALLPNLVTIDLPSAAAGTYEAAGAEFGPDLTLEGIAGPIELVNDGTDDPTYGCSPFIGFTPGAIALLDRGSCLFVDKVENAQDAGAVAVIVVNSLPGTPVTQAGTAPHILIPSVMVSLDDGTTIKAGLPATGRVHRAP
jgi:hypothetical protein